MIELNGEWFSPRNPSKRLPGILTITEGAIELQLFSKTDFLGQTLYAEEKEIHEYTIILGETPHHKITLLNSSLRSKNKIGNDLGTFSVEPRIVFDGAHFGSIQEINITKVTCSFTHLAPWMEDLKHTGPFKHVSGPIEDFDRRLYKDHAIDIGDGFYIHIEQFVRKKDIAKRNKLSYQIHHSVTFANATSMAFVEFEKKVITFQKLMELGLDCNITTYWSMMSRGIKEERPIFIHKASTKKEDAKDSDKYRNGGSMVFSYYKLGELDFKNVIKNWFAAYPLYSVVYNNYLDTHEWFKGSGVLLTSVMFNNRVLNIIQGLEQYHRLSHPDEDEKKETFKAQLKLILNKLDPSERKWLESRTMRRTKTLEDRLTELLDKHAKIFEGIFDEDSERKEFSKELVKIRNALSHGRNQNPDLGAEKYETYARARILLLLCVLDSIGLSQEKAHKLIHRSGEYGPLLEFYRGTKKFDSK